MSPRMQTLGSGDLSDLTQQNFGHQRSASAEERGGSVRGVARKIVKKGANKTMWDSDSDCSLNGNHLVYEVPTTTLIGSFVGRKFIYNLLTFLLTLTLIMGVSIFTYGTFYFAYMPTEVRPMTFTDKHWHCNAFTPDPWGRSKFSVQPMFQLSGSMQLPELLSGFKPQVK